MAKSPLLLPSSWSLVRVHSRGSIRRTLATGWDENIPTRSGTNPDCVKNHADCRMPNAENVRCSAGIGNATRLYRTRARTEIVGRASPRPVRCVWFLLRCKTAPGVAATVATARRIPRLVVSRADPDVIGPVWRHFCPDPIRPIHRVLPAGYGHPAPVLYRLKEAGAQ